MKPQRFLLFDFVLYIKAVLSLKDYQIWDGFFALAKLNGGRTNLGQPPVADVLSEVRSGETSNVRMTAPNEVRLRAGNPWIAARNPRASACAGRGASEATPGRKRRPKMIRL